MKVIYLTTAVVYLLALAFLFGEKKHLDKRANTSQSSKT
jgi:hypothetical protein